MQIMRRIVAMAWAKQEKNEAAVLTKVLRKASCSLRGESRELFICFVHIRPRL